VKLCPYYSQLWESTNRPKDELSANHRYTVGKDEETPTFLRLETWFEVKPRSEKTWHGPLDARYSLEPACKCGSKTSSAWDCYSKVNKVLVLNEGTQRKPFGGYVCFPEDERINKQIVETARSYYGFSYNEGPCTQGADLCAHLAEKGVQRYPDGTFDFRFLHSVARRYMKKFQAELSINDHNLRTKAIER
jgi:hypothetical protein